jgi:uncharacterized protein (TIRG00374 family)
MSSTTDNQRHAVPLKRRIFSLPTLLSFAVAVAFIYFLTTRFDLDWSKAWDNVRNMNPWLYLLALALYYLSFIFRGLRWQVLAQNAGIHELPQARLPSFLRFSQFIVMGWFVNSVAWLRMGDAYRAYAFSEDSGSGFSWSLGTVLAERVMDIATILVLIVVAVAWFSVTSDTGGTGYILLAALLIAVALGALLAIMKGYGARLARLLPGRLEQAYHLFEKGTLGSLRQLPVLFVLGLAGWLLEASRLYFVVQALDIAINVPLVLIVAMAHAILSTVPTPGGIGAVETGVTELLLLGGLALHDAGSVVLVDRSITLVSVIVIGGIMFLLWQVTRSRRRRHRTPTEEQVGRPGSAADA